MQNNFGHLLKNYINNMLSFPKNISTILSVVKNVNPKKIIDIGPGMGKYGLLIREQYLSSKAESGELMPEDDIIIDAIEDTKYFLDFRDKLIYFVYDKVFSDSVFDWKIIFEEKKYDLVLLIDTIEHWKKEKTIELINEIVKYSNILISTPKRVGMYKQHFYGDARHHITQWKEEDFKSFNFDVIQSDLSHIFLIHK